GIDLALEPPADLQSGQQRQVAAVQLQELSEGGAAACAGEAQQLLRVGTGTVAHGKVLYATGHGMGAKSAARIADSSPIPCRSQEIVAVVESPRRRKRTRLLRMLDVCPATCPSLMSSALTRSFAAYRFSAASSASSSSGRSGRATGRLSRSNRSR